jgi:hypothetical protein
VTIATRSLSPKTRFEVLKRDRYTCTYCGKHPPDVLLEVDHIVPVAAGGGKDLTNLTTACTDCNQGKGARMLEEGTSPGVHPAALAEMEERLRQAKQYARVSTDLDEVVSSQIWQVNKVWCRAFRGTAETGEDNVTRLHMPSGASFPSELTVEKFLKKIGLPEVLDAVTIAAERKYQHADDHAIRYFFGICYQKQKRIEEGVFTKDDVERRAEASYFEGYADGKEIAGELENRRIRDLFLNREELGFPSFAAVIQALWPEPD